MSHTELLPVGTRVRPTLDWQWFFRGSAPEGTIEKASRWPDGRAVYNVVMDGNEKPHTRRDSDGSYYCSKHTHQCNSDMVEVAQ